MSRIKLNIFIVLFLISNFTFGQEQYFVQVIPETCKYALIDSLPGVSWVSVNSSTFNKINTRFIFEGEDSVNTNYLYSIDAANGNIISNPLITENFDDIRFDNTNGILYGLLWDSTISKTNFVTIDPSTFNYTVLATLNLSGISQNDAVIDEKNHRFIFIGNDNNGNNCLFSINALTGSIISKPLLSVNIGELAFNNSSGRLYGLRFNSAPSACYFVSINPATAGYSNIDTISTNLGVAKHPTFDEINNRYSFCGTNNNGINYLYTIDATNGHVIYEPPFPTYYTPYNLIETRYDNSTGKLYALFWGPKNIDCSINLTSSNLEISPSGDNGTATITATGGTSPYAYWWNSTPSQITQTATGLTAGIYTVYVIDYNGCSNSATVNMNVDVLTNIFIPDAFAPNSNVLPENQTLYVSGKGIATCDFIVYDRWGEKVFESNSWNDYTKGWNGTYKGKKLPDGVFVYYVKATYNNDEVIEKKGNVTLIRK